MPDTPLPDDADLPATVHLAGPGAEPLLQTALESVGGHLHSARPVHIQYRPGSDVVVRFDATVAWRGGPPTRETLLASTTRHGAPDGTLALEAEVGDATLRVGIWRWPFDPVMPSLETMVTPTSAAKRLDGVLGGPLHLEVVAYRPTERAVVRATDEAGRAVYLKVLPPAQVASIVERHGALLTAGLPVPQVLASDPSEGWIALAEVPGTTLRECIKAEATPWPSGPEYTTMLATIRGTTLDGAQRPRRASDALAHAAMLASVAPDLDTRIAAIAEALTPAAERARLRHATIHGDLHEAQLIVDGDRIVGLLDIDDAATGDPLDDYATVLGHLRYRAVTDDQSGRRSRIGRYVEHLSLEFAHAVTGLDIDPAELVRVTAGVLVGLATGPYRIQHPQWRRDLERVLGEAEQLLTMRPVGATGRR